MGKVRLDTVWGNHNGRRTAARLACLGISQDFPGSAQASQGERLHTAPTRGHLIRPAFELLRTLSLKNGKCISKLKVPHSAPA